MKKFFYSLIFNCVTVFIVAYLWYYHNIFHVILNADHTYISMVIMALYCVAAINLIKMGYYEWQADYLDIDYYQPEFKTFWFTSEFLMGLGLAGTVLGMTMVFSVFADGGVTITGNIIGKLAVGMGTVQYTTFIAILSSLLLRFQLGYIFKAA